MHRKSLSETPQIEENTSALEKATERIENRVKLCVDYLLSPTDTIVDWEAANSYTEIELAIFGSANNVRNEIRRLAPTRDEILSYVTEYEKLINEFTNAVEAAEIGTETDSFYIRVIDYRLNYIEENLKYFKGPLRGYKYFNPENGEFCFNSEEEGVSDLYRELLIGRTDRERIIPRKRTISSVLKTSNM